MATFFVSAAGTNVYPFSTPETGATSMGSVISALSTYESRVLNSGDTLEIVAGDPIYESSTVDLQDALARSWSSNVVMPRIRVDGSRIFPGRLHGLDIYSTEEGASLTLVALNYGRSNIEIIGCRIHMDLGVSNRGYTFGIAGTENANLKIVNCLIYNLGERGIFLAGPCGSYSDGLEIINNVIYGSCHSVTWASALQISGYENAFILNNIISKGDATGSPLYGMDGVNLLGAVHDYNCVYGFDSNFVNDLSPKSANEIESDPDFYNPSIGSFRILGTSPCLDSGIGQDTYPQVPVVDIIGTSRPTAVVSMGAYEEAYVPPSSTFFVNAGSSSPGYPFATVDTGAHTFQSLIEEILTYEVRVLNSGDIIEVVDDGVIIETVLTGNIFYGATVRSYSSNTAKPQIDLGNGAYFRDGRFYNLDIFVGDGTGVGPSYLIQLTGGISNCEVISCKLTGHATCVGGAIIASDSHGHKFKNNVISNFATNGIYCYSTDCAFLLTGYEFINNTIYNIGTDGFYAYGIACLFHDAPKIYNNIVYVTLYDVTFGPFNFYVSDSGGTYPAHFGNCAYNSVNLVEAYAYVGTISPKDVTDLLADPVFVTTSDLRVQSTSPALEAGVGSDTFPEVPTDDYLGDSRATDVVTIGAYEEPFDPPPPVAQTFFVNSASASPGFPFATPETGAHNFTDLIDGVSANLVRNLLYDDVIEVTNDGVITDPDSSTIVFYGAIVRSYSENTSKPSIDLSGDVTLCDGRFRGLNLFLGSNGLGPNWFIKFENGIDGCEVTECSITGKIGCISGGILSSSGNDHSVTNCVIQTLDKDGINCYSATLDVLTGLKIINNTIAGVALNNSIGYKGITVSYNTSALILNNIVRLNIMHVNSCNFFVSLVDVDPPIHKGNCAWNTYIVIPVLDPYSGGMSPPDATDLTTDPMFYKPYLVGGSNILAVVPLSPLRAAGVGSDVYPDVPTTDFVGRTRSSSAPTIGAYEESPCAVPPPPVESDYRTLVLSRNPISYWRLGETQSTLCAYDETGLADGVYINDPTKEQPGAIPGDPNTSVYFEHSLTNYVSVPDFPEHRGLDTLVIELWFKLPIYYGANRRILISKWGGGGVEDDSFTIEVSPNSSTRIEIGSSTPTSVSATGKWVSPEEWHHLILVFENHIGKLYIDDAFHCVTRYLSGTVGNPYELNIGAQSAHLQWTEAYIDEVALYGTNWYLPQWVLYTAVPSSGSSSLTVTFDNLSGPLPEFPEKIYMKTGNSNLTANSIDKNYLFSSYHSGSFNNLIIVQNIGNLLNITDTTFWWDGYAYAIDEQPGLLVENSILYHFTSNSFQIIDVSNVSAFVVLNTTTSIPYASGGWDLVKKDNYLYAVNSGAGLLIYDVSTPSAPFLCDTVRDGSGNTYKLRLSGNYAYVADKTHIRVYDVSDVFNIIPLNSFEVGVSYVYGLEIVGDILVGVGYTEPNVNHLITIDISDPNNLILLSSTPLSGTTLHSTRYSITYDTLSGLILIALETVGLCVVDISDPANPTVTDIPEEAPGTAMFSTIATHLGVTFMPNYFSGRTYVYQSYLQPTEYEWSFDDGTTFVGYEPEPHVYTMDPEITTPTQVFHSSLTGRRPYSFWEPAEFLIFLNHDILKMDHVTFESGRMYLSYYYIDGVIYHSHLAAIDFNETDGSMTFMDDVEIAIGRGAAVTVNDNGLVFVGVEDKIFVYSFGESELHYLNDSEIGTSGTISSVRYLNGYIVANRGNYIYVYTYENETFIEHSAYDTGSTVNAIEIQNSYLYVCNDSGKFSILSINESGTLTEIDSIFAYYYGVDTDNLNSVSMSKDGTRVFVTGLLPYYDIDEGYLYTSYYYYFDGQNISYVGRVAKESVYRSTAYDRDKLYACSEYVLNKFSITPFGLYDNGYAIINVESKMVTISGDYLIHGFFNLSSGNFEISSTLIVDKGFYTVPITVVRGVDFFASPRMGHTQLLTSFTEVVLFPYDSVLWEFGDGSTSTTSNPTHFYSKPGKYSVRLTVYYSAESVEAFKQEYIIVKGPIDIVFD